MILRLIADQPVLKKTVFLSLCLAVLAGCDNSNASVKKQTAAERSWQPAQLINEDAGDAQGARFWVSGSGLAVEKVGNALVVWVQELRQQARVWSKRYVPGKGWQSAQLIDNNADREVRGPQVAIDAAGNALAIWVQGRFDSNVWANRYVVGSGWEGAQRIEMKEGFANFLQLAVNGTGNAIIVWMQSSKRDKPINNHINIWAKRYVAGSGWEDAQFIEKNDMGHAKKNLQVAVDEAGNALVVWQQSGKGFSDIWGNRYVVGSGWEGAQLIEKNDMGDAKNHMGDAKNHMGDAKNPQLAVDKAGNSFVVWQQHTHDMHWKNSSGHSNIWANRYVAGSGWEGAQRITDIYDAKNPQVAVDAAGNALVVWQRNSGIWSARYDTAAKTWMTIDQSIQGKAQYAGDYTTNPKIAVDAAGNALVVWQQRWENGDDGIWASRYIPGKHWQDAKLIQNNNGGRADAPQIAVDAAGNAVALWPQDDGGYWNIWAARYE